MSKIAVFPGSFDPITRGHTDIIQRGLPLFDKLIIGIGENTSKQYLFPLEKRKAWLEMLFKKDPRVEVHTYTGMTIDFCTKHEAGYLLRGLRSAQDFAYEKTIAQLNQAMKADIETVFLLSRPELSHISSTIVREIIVNKGNAKPFVPEEVYELMVGRG